MSNPLKTILIILAVLVSLTGLGFLFYRLSNKKTSLSTPLLSSGLPESNFDLISKDDKVQNREVYTLKGGKVKVTVTSDPDFNADGKIKMGFANREFNFSEDVTLTEDSTNSGIEPKTFKFKKGVIYPAIVYAPADAIVGYYLTIGLGKGDVFFMSNSNKYGLLPSSSLNN